MEVLEATVQTCGEVTFTSREVGRLADTEPYILNTALYYALGVFPSRFRCAEQTPFYDDDKKDHKDLYVHPAVSRRLQGYETRRFAVKGDNYRTESTQENRNLMETGYQKSILHGSEFRRVCTSEILNRGV